MLLTRRNSVFILSIVFFLGLFLFSQPAEAAVECWLLNDQTSCETTNNGTCTWDSVGSYCDRPSCFDGDYTNQSYCQVDDSWTLKGLFNLTCGWELYSSNLCDPNGTNVAGDSMDFFGDACSDFSGDADGCYTTGFCEWNASSNNCTDSTDFTFAGGTGGFKNPSCLSIIDQKTCINITGCVWDATNTTPCYGNLQGIQCSNVNKTICADFTLLSTCCSWNGTSCTTSFQSNCYDTMKAMPSGANFCEDLKSFNNQSLCEEIAGSPWYMPCKWDNVTSECHFNDMGFGGGTGGPVFAGFDEIGTKKGCEAQNGVWKTEQWQKGGGAIKTDSWCEFKFGFEVGGGGNCETACWACETNVSSAQGHSSSTAQSQCTNSALGYCEYTADSNAPNGLGWCNPKTEFIEGGGKSCDDECSACDFLNSPQAKCTGSAKGCVWVADVTAPNTVGYCYGKNEKRCGNDCFSCFTSGDCATTGNGGSGACVWDPVTYLCKPSGFNGEICFDGKDNDNDGNTDCSDADCSTDKFCGGSDLSTGFGKDCPGYTNNNTCNENKCVWVLGEFENFQGGGSGGSSGNVSQAAAGHCDFPGAQCFDHDDNQTACEETTGCSFSSSAAGFCAENSTTFNRCFPQTTQNNCENVTGCSWATDPYSNVGRCEPLVFGQCFGNTTRHEDQTYCERNVTFKGTSTQICSWVNDSFSPKGGFCDPVCFGLSTTDCVTKSTGLCQLQNGTCDPTAFGGGCINADGNKTKCTIEFNATCSWFDDPFANNNVSNSTENSGNVSGWCNPKFAGGFVNFMGDVEPIILGTDGAETVNDSYDIDHIGLRDEFERLVLATRLLDKFNDSSTCNGVPTYTEGVKGLGGSNYTFFWYLDTDGDSTNNCATRDNSSATGYEFSFKYKAGRDTALQETKVSYRCINSSWGVTPIPLITNKQIMCDKIGGGMAGVDKREMFKFKKLFNKSEDIRIYAAVSDHQTRNGATNDSVANDTAGPYYYSQGAFDFEFEDCSNPGGDMDGDGLTASNDPDCSSFLKFGFVPNEMSFQCGDDEDNDGDGKTDCDDEGCKYDTFACGGDGLVADANDKTAPKIVWLQRNTYPQSAFIMYDTNEPANGTLEYYYNDTACKTLNKTIRDIGLVDDFLPKYKMWHDGPIDTLSFNLDAIDNPMQNASTFWFKTKVCDVSGNCAVSACLNFTTKGVFADCKSCKTTFNFPFVPEAGKEITDPTGNVTFKFEFQDGSKSNGSANAAAGVQFNFTQMKSFNLIIENPDVDNESSWQIKLINASVVGKVPTSIQNFSGGTDFQVNSTDNGTYVGLGDTKCQELINAFRPKKIEIGIPGNYTSELWHCTSGLQNCSNKASNATSINGTRGEGTYNHTLNMTLWHVPAEWGC